MKNILTYLALILIISTLGCKANKIEDDLKDNPIPPVSTTELNEEKSQKQETSNTFVLGLDDSFPPMGFRDENNDIVGFDIDIAKEVINDMGMELELKPIDWASKEMELNTDKIDAIWNGFTSTPERAKNMLMSKPYLKNRQIIIVPTDSKIESVSDLSNRKIGVQTGSTSYDTLIKSSFYNPDTALEYPENVSALQDLKIGRIDAIIIDEVVGRYYTSKDNSSFKILDEVLAQEEYVIAFKLENTGLKEKVEKSLSNIIKSGKASEISIKWFGEDIIVK